MSDIQAPAVARRRLRHALRGARDGAGMTQEQAADGLEWSLSKLIRIESGSVGVTVTDVKAMLSLYRVDDPAVISRLISMARVSRQRPWWFEHREDLPAGYAAYLGLEEEASALYFFQPIAIPGILQTNAYAGSILQSSAASELSDEERTSRATLRRMRQERLLSGAHRPAIDAVLDEAVLRRVAGNVNIMRDQLQHLIELADRPQITLRVLPFSAGFISTVSGPFIVLEFPDGADSDAVYVESALMIAQLMDRSDGVPPYRKAFTQLASIALPPDESRAFIARIARELR
jgi:transcriptional regulator with XRE-family HTH domain